MKHKNSYVKKCIAGVLTIALAAGVCQSYGSIEASAQEMTLPGIQQLVQEKQTQGDTFHILEIVADKSNAVLLITEKLVNLAPEYIEEQKINNRTPLIVELPDRHGSQRPDDYILSYVRDAIGVKL